MSLYKKRGLSVTSFIIIINVIFFILVTIMSVIWGSEKIIDYIAIKPSNVVSGEKLWTIITSMFMHAGLTHLLVNMISLMFIGNFVERIIGKKRFIWLYLLSGVVASAFFVLIAFLFNADINTYAVGASGAIFGLGGLLMIITPKLPVLVFFIIPMPMWIAMIFMLVILWLASASLGLPIGNVAHLGGLLAGVAYGVYLRSKYAKKIAMLNRYFI